MADVSAGQVVTKRTTVPARIDAMPWNKFHWLVVLALGSAWLLDGLEIQFASLIGEQQSKSLGISIGDVGISASVYLAGEVVGALLFGRLADRLGRRKLFLITLGLYLLFNGLAGLAWNFESLLFFRFIAGMGIGGEYAAVNSAVDELIPAKYRGRVDLAVNGTYWGGAGIAAAASFLLLDPKLVDENLGWRIALLTGPVIGLAIWKLRNYIPESPRWMISHGQADEAEDVVARMEKYATDAGKEIPVVGPERAIEVRDLPSISYTQIAKVMLREYPTRTVLGFSLMVTQSFLYNAIFFSYAAVLIHFFGVDKASIGGFFLPFALGNLAGPLLLGRYFDTIGRKKMISGTYLISAVLLTISAYMFWQGWLTAVTQTILWCVIFFFASAGASSGYLTVSELFPMEMRGQAISFFFAISQLVGGVVAPALFIGLMGDVNAPDWVADRTPLFIGYLVGAGLMALGGLVTIVWGVNSEGKSLEDLAAPLSMVSAAPAGVGGDAGAPPAAPTDGPPKSS